MSETTLRADRADELATAREYDRWIGGRSLSGRGYRFLAGVPGSMLVNTPVFRLDRELVLKPEQLVLDVACGRGSILHVLSSKVRLQRAPVGLDISREMLRQARADGASAGRMASLVQGSATCLPFADGLFDVAVCSYLVKHLDDAGLGALLAELLRVLKPGGLAVLWEFAPTRSRLVNRWNRRLLTLGVRSCKLRSYSQLAAAATSTGFDWVDNAHLRPFIFPPIPRVSLVLGKAPEGWRERTGLGRARRAAVEALRR